MAAIKVIKEFRDKDRFNKAYLVGEILDFDKARAKALADRGLVEFIGRGARAAKVKNETSE